MGLVEGHPQLVSAGGCAINRAKVGGDDDILAGFWQGVGVNPRVGNTGARIVVARRLQQAGADEVQVGIEIALCSEHVDGDNLTRRAVEGIHVEFVFQ